MMLRLQRELRQIFIGLALLAVVGIMNLNAAPKAEAHARLRAWFGATEALERHFMPGEIGAEPGARALPAGRKAFLTRSLGALGMGAAGSEWARANQLTARLNFSHNLSRVFPPALYAEHPEFFPEESGRRLQPPLSGNVWWQPDLGRADVAAWSAEAARKYFSSNPDAVSFALGVNDGLVFGESAETRALTLPLRWFRERPDYSNLVFTFMNRAAEDLARTHPEKYVGALAYYWAEDTPDFPVHPRVIPFLTADRSQGYDRDFLREDRALQKRWVERLRAGAAEEIDRRSRDVGGEKANVGGGPAGNLSDSELRSRSSELDPMVPGLRLGLYDYLYGGGFLVPRFHPHLLAQHLRYTRRLGFTDYYAEVYPNWGLDGPQPWLVAQLLQDPEQSADRLLAEYFRRYFKEAAAPMRRFFARCERQWMRQPGPAYWLKHYRNESQATLFPSRVCVKLREFLDDAAQRAKSEVVRARVRQVSDAFGVTERFVAMYETRDRLARWALAADPQPAKLNKGIADFAAARAEFVRYTQTLQQTQPGLIAPFQLTDYVTNDPTAMASALADAMPAAEGSKLDRASSWRALPINGSLSGQLKPVRMIAGLIYSVAVPEPWQSRVEPSEYHNAEWIDGRLCISGTKSTSVYRWVRLPEGTKEVQAILKVRGAVSTSGVVNLTLGWLDEGGKHLGLSLVRLPEGEWPEWRTLLQRARPPEGAVWVGIGVTVMHQTGADWVELEKFGLETSR